MDLNIAKYPSNSSFGSLNVKKSAYKAKAGAMYINFDKDKLEELAKTCNIKISGGKEYMGLFSLDYLNITVTPLKRSRNPFIRWFNIDAVTGKFATEARLESTTLIDITRQLVNKLQNRL